MKVVNDTSFELRAFWWDIPRGYGDDVCILPGETVEVVGPDKRLQTELAGRVICHEAPDDEHGFHLSPRNPLFVGSAYRGVVVRHYLDERIYHVIPCLVLA